MDFRMDKEHWDGYKLTIFRPLDWSKPYQLHRNKNGKIYKETNKLNWK